ncbi:hypothetical protein MHK_006589 [Candidatus Magnetomorum sp. HK-1]|nr:hypothetical protein MHK_006589 [Candidatus Magnetomorum sp. HK-1]
MNISTGGVSNSWGEGINNCSSFLSESEFSEFKNKQN